MTQIEVTMLGTTAGVPTKKRNHAAVHILYRSKDEFSLLFDCGEGTQRQILFAGINFMRIDNIFISHWHADHYAGLLGLLETMNLEQRKRPLRIFGPEATKFVDLLLQLGYANKYFDIMAVDAPHEGRNTTKLLEDKEFFVESIPVSHRIPAVGFAFVEKDRMKIDKEKTKKLGLPSKSVIYKKLKKDGIAKFHEKTIRLSDLASVEKGKRVAYSGDTMACDSMVTLSRDADLLIHDSTFFMPPEELKAEGYRHAGFEDVLDIAKRANVKQLLLTHISRRYQNEKEMAEKIKNHKNIKIAKDLMKIVLK